MNSRIDSIERSTELRFISMRSPKKALSLLRRKAFLAIVLSIKLPRRKKYPPYFKVQWVTETVYRIFSHTCMTRRWGSSFDISLAALTDSP